MLLKPELFNKDAEKKALSLLAEPNSTLFLYITLYLLLCNIYFALRIYNSHSTVLDQITDFKSHKHHKMNLTKHSVRNYTVLNQTTDFKSHKHKMNLTKTKTYSLCHKTLICSNAQETL
jgi:hypothetical protein